MNNTELLSAISDMMVQKLDEKITPQIKNLENRFDGLENRFDGLENRFDDLENRFDGLDNRFDGLDNRFGDLENRFDDLENRFDGLENRFDGLSNTVDSLSDRFDGLDNRVKNIELTLENDVVPRLSHIEQCYIDTYERYQDGVKKLDDMQRDIEVIKITVTDHSEELNKITGPYLVK